MKLQKVQDMDIDILKHFLHTNAIVLTMMVVQLSKKLIEIILVGDPIILSTQNQHRNQMISKEIKEINVDTDSSPAIYPPSIKLMMVLLKLFSRGADSTM